MTYCIDTSALIAAWSERYPPRLIPPFWAKMDELILAGKLVAPEEVRREIQKKDDGLFEWVNARKAMFVDLEEPIQLQAKKILAQFPFLTKNVPGKSVADPFVIALAEVRGLTVITEEGRGSAKKPKIPDVCDSRKVECVTLLGFLDAEKWILQ